MMRFEFDIEEFMAKKSKFKSCVVISVRFEEEEYERVKAIAELESHTSGNKWTAQDLIREAVKFTYGDNERLRECFRRTRMAAVRKYKNNY